jgi:Flp pilus assembly protein TadD
MIPGLLRRQPAQALLLSLSLIALGAQADVYDDVERMVRNGQLDQATQRSAEHLQKSPQDPQMRLLSSRILDARGRTDEAVSVLESLTRDYPELPEPHNNLAVQYARLGRTQEALSSLQRAIQARPDYAVALENLGDLYVGLALQAYEQAHKAPTSSVSAGRKAETLSPVLRR